MIKKPVIAQCCTKNILSQTLAQKGFIDI